MNKIITFLKNIFAEHFYGEIVLRFENGKITHVEKVRTEAKWEFKNLPE